MFFSCLDEAKAPRAKDQTYQGDLKNDQWILF